MCVCVSLPVTLQPLPALPPPSVVSVITKFNEWIRHGLWQWAANKGVCVAIHLISADLARGSAKYKSIYTCRDPS